MLNWLRPRQPRPATIPPGERAYAIGDIHGRDDLFAQLLRMIEADHAARSAANFQLILLGDLIDRGPSSARVVRRAMKLSDAGTTIVLKGNHEATMLDALSGDREMFSLWLRFGGRAALASWGIDEEFVARASFEDLLAAAIRAVPPEERAWLARTRHWVQIGDYYFVHAGVRPGVSLDRQSVDDNLKIREEFLTSRKYHGAVVVHGHSISANIEDMGNRIGIDTGAHASGLLTALGLEGTDRWFIQTRSELPADSDSKPPALDARDRAESALPPASGARNRA